MQKRENGVNRDKNSLLTLVDKLLYWLGFIIALIGAFNNYILMTVGLFIMFLSLVFYRLLCKSSIKFKKQKKSEKNKIKIYHITKIVYKLLCRTTPKQI
jgi:hypothetical protein